MGVSFFTGAALFALSDGHFSVLCFGHEYGSILALFCLFSRGGQGWAIERNHALSYVCASCWCGYCAVFYLDTGFGGWIWWMSFFLFVFCLLFWTLFFLSILLFFPLFFFFNALFLWDWDWDWFCLLLSISVVNYYSFFDIFRFSCSFSTFFFILLWRTLGKWKWNFVGNCEHLYRLCKKNNNRVLPQPRARVSNVDGKDQATIHRILSPSPSMYSGA